MRRNRIHSLYRLYRFLRAFFRHSISLLYKGSRYECCFCQRSFDAFLARGIDAPILRELNVVGGGYRENSVCPRCYSSDRERLIYAYLKKYKQEIFSVPTRMLHVAPEESLSMQFMKVPSIHYTSADVRSPAAEFRVDVTEMEIEDETYDIIICNHVLEHLQDDRKAMSELCRVLRPGGCAILQVPISQLLNTTVENRNVTSPTERLRLFGQRDHVRIYGNDYLTRLESAGFTVDAVSVKDSFSRQEILKYSLLPDERVFICTKRPLQDQSSALPVVCL